MPARTILWLLILVGVASRAGAVLVLQSHTVPRSTYEHGEIAANLLTGKGFAVKFLGGEGPTSQQAPIYPFLVAGAFLLGGVETPTSLLILELGQALFLGGGLVLGTWILAKESVGVRYAPFAALAAALHPTLVYAATHVQVALLAAVLLTWMLAWSFRAGRTGKIGDAAIAGAWLALLVLTDPILGLVAPGASWAMARGRGIGGWKGPATMIGVMILAIAPWTARNAMVHGELMFVKSTFGYVFWQGNSRLSQGTDKVVRPSVEEKLQPQGGTLSDSNRALWSARHEAGYLDDIALTARDYEELGRLPEPERGRFLARRAFDDLKADPWRYPKLCLRRLWAFVVFDETNPKARNLIYRIGHLGLTALAIAGLCLGGAAYRRAVAPTLLTAGLITAFHAATIVSARFHIPLEPLMCLWGAGLINLGSGRRLRDQQPQNGGPEEATTQSRPANLARTRQASAIASASSGVAARPSE